MELLTASGIGDAPCSGLGEGIRRGREESTWCSGSRGFGELAAGKATSTSLLASTRRESREDAALRTCPAGKCVVLKRIMAGNVRAASAGGMWT